MLRDWWPLLVILVGAAVVIAAAAAAVLLLRRRGHPAPGEALEAAPEDRPIAAIVVNPIHVEAQLRGRIDDVCTSLGWAPPLWLETTVDDPGTGQAAAAIEKGADVVLACGGDGTARAVAQALAGTGVAMGLVPLGTGNLLARTIGAASDPIVAARIALTGDDRTIDVGRVRVDGSEEERVFLVMAGTGLDAAIMENTPDAMKAKVGTLAYVLSGFRGMFAQQTRVTLTVDDGPAIRRRSRTVVVGNSGTLLGGLVLMPAATIDDGMLDIVNITPTGLAGWIAVLLRVMTRKRRGHRRIEHWQATSFVIATDAPQAAQIDGDPIGEVTKLRIRIDPAALVVRVPHVPDDATTVT